MGMWLGWSNMGRLLHKRIEVNKGKWHVRLSKRCGDVRLVVYALPVNRQMAVTLMMFVYNVCVHFVPHSGQCTRDATCNTRGEPYFWRMCTLVQINTSEK